MQKPTATLGNDGRSPDAAGEIAGAQPPQARVRAMKFTYASGSRPLDGYTIKRGIGIGGFGEVYFAVSDAGKEVALKRIQRNLDVEIRGVSQCLNLKHPNLIALWDIRQDSEGESWVVMEFVAGETLKDVVDRNPNGMPMTEAHAWFKGIVAGVKYLHDHGIVHRDLKPGNIFEDEGLIKIGDYGLSKFISSSRCSGHTESVGTFHYMAPEIGKGDYGKGIDVYALGIILFEMITGDVPFDGESGQEIIMKHLTAEPVMTAVPEPSRGVIMRALAKDPVDRYVSVDQMLIDLRIESAASTDANETRTATSADAPSAKPLVITDSAPKETLFIGDDEPGIVLGEVKHVSAEMPHPSGVAPTQAAPAKSHVPYPAGPVQPANESPIVLGVTTSGSQLVDWWNQSTLSHLLKIAIFVVVAALAVIGSESLVPIGMVLGGLYAVYAGVRAAVLYITSKTKPKQEELRQALSMRPLSDRLSDLTGSLIVSAVIASGLALVCLLVSQTPFHTSSAHAWAFFAWFSLAITTCAWTVLCLGKWWETSEGDPIWRRSFLLAGGLVAGAVVFGLGDLLLVQRGPNLGADSAWMPWRELGVPTSMQLSGGSLALPAYLIFFGGLLFVLRWWKQADPLRTSRLSLLAVMAAVLWGLIIPFAQPWGFMIAGGASIAAQLSAPWINPTERAEVRQQLQQV